MVRRIDPDPRRLPLVVTREQAVAAGLTAGQIDHRVRSGRWLALHRGIYVRVWERDQISNAFDTRREEHLLRAVSAVLARPGSVLSHGSAAVALRLPLASGVPHYAHLTVPPDRWAGRRAGVHVHHGLLEPEHVVTESLWGAPVTSGPRTWFDVARTHPFVDALSAGDRALREGLMTTDAALAICGTQQSLRGTARALRAITFCDGRRETAIESLSWVRFLDWQLPLPAPQQDIWDDSGLVGRVDFLWPGCRVVGEADGRVKYTDPEALWAEKRRELRLQRLGYTIVRWTWADVARVDSPFRRVLERVIRQAA